MKFKDQIIEWLYINDNKFPNKNEWRENFIDFLTELENKQPSEYQIGYDPSDGKDFGHAILIKPRKCGDKIIHEIINSFNLGTEQCKPNYHNTFIGFNEHSEEFKRKIKTQGNGEITKKKIGIKF